jgi:hypothetical protein
MKIRASGSPGIQPVALRLATGNAAFLFLLTLCLARLWLMPLSSSFWVDEMVTVFVVRHGPGHPSLAAAPQVPASIYYLLPGAAEALLGFSETTYRLPSILLMGAALFLVARLAARLIHPQAGWFAVFACLALRGINYEAADARPYALGSCVAGASLWFLIRWLDSARWRDALLFVVFAALLWRVHLIFWPFYLVIAAYTLVRLARRETRVGYLRAGAIFTLLGIALLPVLVQALGLLRDAKAHVIVPPPSLGALTHALQWRLVMVCGAGAWLLRRLFRWQPDPAPPSWASRTLILCWWLCHPLCLFGFSWLTGNSVFVPRYLSLALPGAALAATALAARSIPATQWRPLAALLAAGVLLALGQWRNPWPPHHNSDWRAAARQIRELPLAAGTPVICPSPFIEATPPAWRPDYSLPGFLYAHLPVYPIPGRAYLFPFETSREAEQYAARLSQETLSGSGRFVLYGGDHNVLLWRSWFARRPELAGWHSRRLGPFGDVEVVVFEKGLGATGDSLSRPHSGRPRQSLGCGS